MRRVVECLKAQHRDIEASIEAIAQLGASARREECLRAFAALAARIARQLEAEEELLGRLYGPGAGDVAQTLREDHRQLTALVAACHMQLEGDDLVGFADDAQTLMLKFALHAAREERALASAEAGPGEHESAVGLFVERMAVDKTRLARYQDRMAHTTTPGELEQLSQAVSTLLARQGVQDTIAQLKGEVKNTSDTFVWATIPLPSPGVALPPHILSGWIFVLKSDTPSGAHQHPNSVQHMVLLEGRGRSCVGGEWRQLAQSGWTVIPEGVAHEFFPEGEAMVVMSFHTCAAEDLEEVAEGSGQSRHYA